MSIAGKKGVDISASNGNIDVEKIKKAGYEFVMICCGYGNDDTNQDDSQFENNVRKCEAAGLPWGVYLYSYALNTAEAKSEAQHVLRLLKGKKPSLPIAFDMEDADGYKSRNGMPNNKTLVDICKTFLSIVQNAGYYVSLYASLSWLENQLNDSSLLNSYDIWVAQWSSKCQFKGNYGMWQYGGETNLLESNSIPGVGVIDKNYAYIDYPTVIKQKGLNGWRKSGETSTSAPSKPAASKPATSAPAKVSMPDAYCCVRSGGRWLPKVKNLTDFAGIRGVPITDVAIKFTEGNCKYRVKVDGRWLPFVTGYDANDDVNGYAGNGRPIEAVQVYYNTPERIRKGLGYLRAKYRVSPINGDYYDWQYDNETSNGQDGYAGCRGIKIDRLQLVLSK